MELIYQLFVIPSLGMRRASQGKKLPWACLVVALAILSRRIGELLMLPGTASQAKLALSIVLVIDLIVAFGALFFLTAIFHLAAEISGGRGRGASLYTVFSLALIPFWMITPLAITLKLLEKEGLLLFFALWLIISGWTAALFVIGMREVHHLSWGKTAAVFIFPQIGIGLAIIILFLLLLTVFFLSFANIFQFIPMIN